MKNKIIITAIVAGLAAFASFGLTCKDVETICKTNANYRLTLTKADWKSVFDNKLAEAKTNALERLTYGVKIGFSTPNGSELIEEYDEKFSKAGWYSDTISDYMFIPKCVEVYLNSNIETNPPNKMVIQLVKKYKTCPQRLDTVASLPEYINAFATTYPFGLDMLAAQRLPTWKKHVLNMAQLQLKRAMREQGKSFVSVDGKTNPFQDEIDALSNALNAPKFAGLKEWVAKWYPTYQWQEITFKSDAEIKKLQDDIFYGDKVFTKEANLVLQVHLGVEGCNAFIKKYNGDTQQ